MENANEAAIVSTIKKVSQTELAKQYKYYSCTALKATVVAELQQQQQQQEIPVAADEESKQEVEIAVDNEMSGENDEELDSEQLVDIFSKDSKKVQQQLTGGENRRRLLEKFKNLRNQQKKRAYEFGVVYKKVSGKMGVRKMKILKGANSVDKFKEPEQYDLMRKKFAKVLVSSGTFDVDTFNKCGGIFNRKFWEINVAWGPEDSLQQNLTLADTLLIRKLAL